MAQGWGGALEKDWKGAQGDWVQGERTVREKCHRVTPRSAMMHFRLNTLTSYTCLCSNREMCKHMHGTRKAGGCELWLLAQVFLLLDGVCMWNRCQQLSQNVERMQTSKSSPMLIICSNFTKMIMHKLSAENKAAFIFTIASALCICWNGKKFIQVISLSFTNISSRSTHFFPSLPFDVPF